MSVPRDFAQPLEKNYVKDSHEAHKQEGRSPSSFAHMFKTSATQLVARRLSEERI